MAKTPIHSFHGRSTTTGRATSVRVPKRAQRQANLMAEIVAAAGKVPVQVRRGNASAEIPTELVGILGIAAAAASAGETITLLVGDDELTSQQVADILNVSRPHVIKLARVGILPYKKVGNRHRFSAADVAAYERSEAARRDRILTEMTRSESYTPEDF